MKRIMAVLGFGFVLTDIVCLNIGFNFSVVLSAVCLASCIFILAVRKRFFDYNIFVAVAGIMLAAALCAINIGLRVMPAKSLDSKTVHATAQIIDTPEINDGYTKYTFETLSINGNENNFKFIAYFSEPINAQPYDFLSGEMAFYINEEGKNYEWADGIMLRAFIRDYKISCSNDKPLHSYVLKLRERIREGIYNCADSETAEMINALVLNDKSGLNSDVISNFRTLGLSHATAVSGMHLSVIIMALIYMLTLFGLSPRKRSAICIIAVLLYLTAVGFVFSAVRSGIMIILTLSASFFRREADPVNSLGFACLFLVAINPYTAINTGFLLSVTATLGMILLFPVMLRFIMKIVPLGNLAGKIIRAIVVPFFQSVCAMIFTLPVIYSTFGTVSVISPIANMICSPIFSAIICLGIIMIILLPIPYVPDFIGYICSFFVKALTTITDYLANMFNPMIGTDLKEIGLCIAASLIIFAVCVLLFMRSDVNRRHMLKVASLCCAAVFTVTMCTSYAFNCGVTQIVILDSGNGVCAAIVQDGKMIVCGLPENASYTLSSFAEKNGINEVQAALFPSLDKYYYKNTAYVLRKLKAKLCAAPSNEDAYYELPNSVSSEHMTAEFLDDIEVEFKTGTIKITVGHTSILFISRDTNIDALSREYLSCDVAVIPPNPPDKTEDIRSDALIVCSDHENALKISPLISSCSDMTYFTSESGNLIVRTRGNGDITVSAAY